MFPVCWRIHAGLALEFLDVRDTAMGVGANGSDDDLPVDGRQSFKIMGAGAGKADAPRHESS